MFGVLSAPMKTNPFVLLPLSAALYSVFVPLSKNATPFRVSVPFEQTPPAKVTATLNTFPRGRVANEPEKLQPRALLPLIVPAAESVTVTSSVPAAVAAEPEYVPATRVAFGVKS